MKNDPIKSVLVVLFSESRVLLVREGESSGHKTGIYGLPAGRLEENETYEKAAVRELNEETNLQTSEKYLIKLPTFYEADLKRKDGLKRFCAWSFLCTQYWGETKKTLSETPEWIDINKVKSLHLQVNVDRIINEALEYKKREISDKSS